MKSGFTGGGLERLIMGNRTFSGKYDIQVGILNGERHTRGNRTVSTAMILYVHENGTNGVPARPTLAPAVKKYKWRVRTKLLFNALAKGSTKYGIMNDIGQDILDQAKKNMMNISTPPLAHSTIKSRVNKGTSNPLIDTKQLYNSLSYKIGR